MITGKYPNLRLRRNRKHSWTRKLIAENTLSPSDFILPIFLIEGSNKKESISTMPGVYRYTINRLSQIIDKTITCNTTKDFVCQTFWPIPKTILPGTYILEARDSVNSNEITFDIILK